MANTTEQLSRKGNPLSIPLVLLLVVITVSYRVIASSFDFLGNTAPLMAIAFGGAMLLGARFWWLPVLLLVVSDLILGFVNGSGGIGGYTLISAFFYLSVAWVGGRAGSRERIWPMMWCGTLFCGILFYVVANTYSFLAWPGYEKSLAGWWQSQTIGNPNFAPPAWVFLRNALVADSIWCALAGLLFFWNPKRVATESTVVS